MRLSVERKSAALLLGLILLGLSTNSGSTAQTAVPQPVLQFIGPEYYEASGKQWTRYRYGVFNSAEFPNELFAAAPDLPPCGQNTKSSRTWVDIYDSTGKRLYGFCAFSSRDDLGRLWFALERDVVPPSWVYIEMVDRKTNTKYKSNLAETTE